MDKENKRVVKGLQGLAMISSIQWWQNGFSRAGKPPHPALTSSGLDLNQFTTNQQILNLTILIYNAILKKINAYLGDRQTHKHTG